MTARLRSDHPSQFDGPRTTASKRNSFLMKLNGTLLHTVARRYNLATPRFHFLIYDGPFVQEKLVSEHFPDLRNISRHRVTGVQQGFPVSGYFT